MAQEIGDGMETTERLLTGRRQTAQEVLGLPIKIVEGLPRNVVYLKDGEGRLTKLTYTTPEMEEMDAKGIEYDMDDGRITGAEFAGDPKEAIQQVVEIFQNSDIAARNIKSLDTFEQTMVATMLRQFHILVEKQRGYRHSNVRELGESGVLKRISEKVIRAKEELGDPDTQVQKLKELHEKLPDDATTQEMLEHLKKEQSILFPGNQNEDSIDNLVLDIANLCEILYVLHFDGWYKPLDEDV